MILGDIEKIKNSELFKSFKELYLINCFLIKGEEWEYSFYSKEEQAAKIFTIKNEEVKIKERQSEMFREAHKDIKELNTEKIKVFYNNLLEILNKKKNEEYANEIVTKEIYVLQNIENIPAWNVTLITSSLNVINIKINASNGEIISDKKTPVFSFKAK